jgi:hypothetical protein
MFACAAQEATVLDPAFARCWALLALVHLPPAASGSGAASERKQHAHKAREGEALQAFDRVLRLRLEDAPLLT